MLSVILTRGLPGSGKTVWAKKLIENNSGMYKRIGTDDLREMFDGGKWSPSNEKFMLKIRDDLIIRSLEEGKHVIVDATNLNPKHGIHIRDLVKGKAEVFIEDFTDVSLDTCIIQDLKRINSVGEQVIREMYNKYLRLILNPPEYDINLPDCIICDLDGTIALSGWRNPYDASECDKDPENIPITKVLRAYVNWLKLVKVIFISGREEKYREPTERWINKIFWDWDFNFKGLDSTFFSLYMRPTGDFRKDVIVKKEIYDTEISDKYNVVLVLDDRLQVCKMWHSLGLPLLRVGDPEANF